MRAPRIAPRIGALRHRVTIEEPVRTADEAGGAEITWQTVASVWAEIQPKTGREVFESDQLGGRVTHDVRMRFRKGVTPKMRIFHNALTDIRFAANVGERGEWLICACEEVTV
ncbi:MAG: SPP1 family predicted phage head-tail adaptor [Hyphomicrobiaceae bacterium]|jgi:SPP1 family predicted phage head-tail adaptor